MKRYFLILLLTLLFFVGCSLHRGYVLRQSCDNHEQIIKDSTDITITPNFLNK